MERAILVIVMMVAAVGMVGLYTSYNFLSGGDSIASPTGNVVAGEEQACGSCSGYAPVCATINHRFITFENACEARCQGAEIAVERACEAIQRS